MAAACDGDRRTIVDNNYYGPGWSSTTGATGTAGRGQLLGGVRHRRAEPPGGSTPCSSQPMPTAAWPLPGGLGTRYLRKLGAGPVRGTDWMYWATPTRTSRRPPCRRGATSLVGHKANGGVVQPRSRWWPTTTPSPSTSGHRAPSPAWRNQPGRSCRRPATASRPAITAGHWPWPTGLHHVPEDPVLHHSLRPWPFAGAAVPTRPRHPIRRALGQSKAGTHHPREPLAERGRLHRPPPCPGDNCRSKQNPTAASGPVPSHLLTYPRPGERGAGRHPVRQGGAARAGG